jgi:hypothetical protein
MCVLQRFTSAFTETGENMNLKPNAVRERQVKARMMPAWIKLMTPAFVAHHRLRMLISGAYAQAPFDYSLYTFASPNLRVLHQVSKPTARWPGRH